MRLKRWLRKVGRLFKLHIYLPIWNGIYLPIHSVTRRWSFRRAEFQDFVIEKFWDFIEFLERSPETVKSATTRFVLFCYNRIARLRITSVVVRVIKRFLGVYFIFVNFRRLLVCYLILDYFSGRLVDTAVDPFLRLWNLCLLTIAYNVLYMLMEGADAKLRFDSHDMFTKWYIKRYLDGNIVRYVSEEQANDKWLRRYLKLRYRRNAILCIIGYFYSGQPFFKGGW